MKQAHIKLAPAVRKRSMSVASGLSFAWDKATTERLGVLASESRTVPFKAWAPHGLVVLLTALAASPACAGDVIFLGDFEDSTSIEALRYNTAFAPGALVELAPAIVTATTLTAATPS